LSLSIQQWIAIISEFALFQESLLLFSAQNGDSIKYLSAREDEKNRAEHRHHAIDALVIGLTTRSILKRFATANARGFSDRILPPPFPVDRAWLERNCKNMLIQSSLSMAWGSIVR
jgi:hypothetical protein